MRRWKNIFLTFAGVLFFCVIIYTGFFTQLGYRFSFPFNVWTGRVKSALQPVNCPIAEVRRFLPSQYQGRMIDSHFHVSSIPDWPAGMGGDLPNETYAWLGKDITIDEIACTLMREGTEAAFAFINVWPAIEQPSLGVARKLEEKYSDLFVSFIQPPADPRPVVEAMVLEKMLSGHDGLFQGLGEIGNFGPLGPVSDPPPNDPLYLKNYEVAREYGLMVYYHLGRDHQEEFEEVLRNNRDINFIFHGDTVTSVEEDVPRIVGEILGRNPNVFYTIDELYGNVWLLHENVTKQEFMDHFENYEPLIQTDLANWQRLIESYPDQVMWGTDRGDQPAWSYDQDVGFLLTDYARSFVGRLDESVQTKFAYENAAKLIQGAGGVRLENAE